MEIIQLFCYKTTYNIYIYKNTKLYLATFEYVVILLLKINGFID